MVLPISVLIGCIWSVSACLAGLAPQRFHWPAAWTLIAVGIPLLGWVTLQAGPFWGLIFLMAGASVLRWPLIRATQHVGGFATRALTNNNDKV